MYIIDGDYMKKRLNILYKYKKYIIYIIFLLFSITYLYLFYKYGEDNINKYNNTNDGTLISKIVYSSLNKIVDFNEEITLESIVQPTNLSNSVTKDPIVYIYNTHDTESYSLPVVNDYSVTPNVKIASYILKDYLNDYGIESTVESKPIKDYLKKHNLNYNYSYQASREYLLDELKKYDYKLLIDLHRDSASIKNTLYEKDNKRYARIMFVLGKDYDTYKDNEAVLNDLNNRINKEYKGLSRGIFIRKTSKFNQDISPRSLLIEVGGVDNTLEEINNTLEMLAKILFEYINEEIYGRE